MNSMLPGEILRITHHLERAEHAAAQRDLTPLGRVQRLVRTLLLSELARYRAEGRFPVNRDFAEQTPYFVDASGVRCAMAHLLELGGEGELVQQIARDRNNAWIRELVSEPRLLAWLEAAGLTVAEAAAIQPSYCSLITDCICGGDFSYIEYPVPASGVFEGVVLAGNLARVEQTYGDTAGIAIGNEVPLAGTYAVGARVVAPVDSAASVSGYAAITLDANGLYACSSQGVSSAPPLDAAQFAQAVLATDCAAALRAIDPAWRQPSPGCNGGGIGDPLPEGRGCSTGASVDAASVGILLALVAAIVHRSRR